LVPGWSFYLAGWQKVGWCLFAGYLGAAVVCVAELGRPAANWAFMFIISAHTASVSQRSQQWLAEQRLIIQMAVGMILFTAISLLVYVPARGWFERHIAKPLPTDRGVLVLDARTRPASIQRGDWLAYRIDGGYADGTWIRDGYGFGPVLALPGDRVTFEEKTFRVNGTAHTRLPQMPRRGELVISQKQWLVWPHVTINMHGMAESAVEQAVLKVAVAKQEDLVGRPFKRWFFRKQTGP
jgi:hypothetical protein